MTNTAISGATSTTPVAGDKIPLSRGPSNVTPYYADPAAIAALGFSIANGLVATGTGQGTALLLANGINVVTSCAAPTAVILPAVPTVALMMLVNDDPANVLTFFPPVGGAFTTKSVNASLFVPVTGVAWLIWKGGLNWSVR